MNRRMFLTLPLVGATLIPAKEKKEESAVEKLARLIMEDEVTPPHDIDELRLRSSTG